MHHIYIDNGLTVGYLSLFCPAVFTEGGQVRGGDQGPHGQAEGGKVSKVLYLVSRIGYTALEVLYHVD